MGSYDENRPWDIIWAQSWLNWNMMLRYGLDVVEEVCACEAWG